MVRVTAGTEPAEADWLLRALVAALALDTALAMGLGLSGSHDGGWDPDAARTWASLAWFVLAAALAARSVMVTRRLRQLVRTRVELMDAVEETSHDWLWEASVRAEPVADLVFTYCSPSVRALLDYRPEEMVGRPASEFTYPEDLTQFRIAIEAALASRRVDNVELRWRHADGHAVRMLGDAIPIADRSGRVIAFRGTRRLAEPDTDRTRRLEGIRHRVSELLAAGSLRIALQPIVDLDMGTWVGVEALARFPDARGPDVWFPEAHEVGLGVELELAALDAGLACLEHLPTCVGLALNASPQLILDRRLAEVLTGTGVPIDRITLEMTEHAAVADYGDIHHALAPLRERGLRLAVDDTGAGYASFSHVLRLRPDTIKLDRSLIGGIDDDPARRAFVTAVVLLGLELGAQITAEGVETPAEHAALATLGVDAAQGYLLARPSTDPEVWRGWQNRAWSPSRVGVPAPA